MNCYSKFAMAGLMFASSTSFAGEPTQGWYAGLSGGLTYTPTLTFNFVNPFTRPAYIFTPTFVSYVSPLQTFIESFSFANHRKNSGKIKYGMGGNGTFQVGYRCNYMRFEGEFLYNYSGYSKLTINGRSLPRKTRRNNFSMKGNTTAIAGLFNAYYEIYEDGTDPTWIPYVGLGIGYSYIQNQLRYYFWNYNLNQLHNKNSTSEPVAQAILGLSYLYNDDLTMNIDMRYLTSNKLKNSNQRYSIATLNFGFNYSFDDGSY